MFIIPIPRLGVDRFTNTTQNTEGTQIMAFDMVRAQATEQTDGCWCGVELRELVLLDGLPVSGRSRVHWCRFEDGGGYSVQERAVYDVSVYEKVALNRDEDDERV